ncbi:EMAL1 protein, partial [Atractosteus spatula]|nr:EMAL1 protein [Atractosteus spatula]
MEDGFSSYSSLYDTSSLLQFCNDDSASAASSMEVTDRIASLEQRVQMQEDEIQLLKSALADVVRRLNISEEQQAMLNRKGPTKARPLMQGLPLRPTVNNGTVLPKKTSTLPSPSGTRKDTSSPATKSTVKRTSSTERVGTLARRESTGESKSSRTRAGSTSSNSSGKKNSESKLKEPVFSAGMRRVTHCKVTVQIFLSHPQKRIGSSEAQSLITGVLTTQTECMTPDLGTPSEQSSVKTGVRKAPSFILPFPKSPSQTVLEMSRSPSFKSPLKSPSQYFQICY